MTLKTPSEGRLSVHLTASLRVLCVLTKPHCSPFSEHGRHVCPCFAQGGCAQQVVPSPFCLHPGKPAYSQGLQFVSLVKSILIKVPVILGSFELKSL